MKNPRTPVLIMIVSLVAVAILSLQVFIRPFAAKGERANYVGMGDLRALEAQSAIRNNRAEASSQTYSGIGDLRRFEAQKLLPNTGAEGSGQSYAGFGDLRRFEAQSSLPGAGANPAQPASRACPQQSTPSGERDAGASAPAYVLQAMGCPANGE